MTTEAADIVSRTGQDDNTGAIGEMDLALHVLDRWVRQRQRTAHEVVRSERRLIVDWLLDHHVRIARVH